MSSPAPPPAPLVAGDPDAPFWQAWAQGEFLLHRCGMCGRHYWPASCCTVHGLAPMRWVPASGRGKVETYTVFHHAFAPELAGRIPYNVAVIRLEEGPLFHSRVVDLFDTPLRTGLPVRIRMTTGSKALPLFIPAGN